jgi:eukaryotic-like serine/threonine-protein kinase
MSRGHVGQVLQDTYRLERLIGEGGMGTVYEASHLRLARRFAVKLLSSESADNATALTRFRQEALITSGLGHPHILEVTDFNYTDAGVPYIVVELLRGEDLASRLQRVGRLELREATLIFAQTASALHAAHGSGVVHRDLKPHNLFLCERTDGRCHVKLLDFGVSKVLAAQTKVTRTGTLVGTPIYMAPEQAEERPDAVDVRTDVYAMGVILYEMLSGRPPFSAESIPALLYKIVTLEPTPLQTLLPDLPGGIGDVVGVALRKRGAERHASMDVFWDAFVAALRRAGIDPPIVDSGSVSVSRLTASAATPTAAQPSSPPIVSRPITGPAAIGQQTTLSASVGELRAARPSLWRRQGPLLAAIIAMTLGVGAGGLLLGLHLNRDRGPTPGAGSSVVARLAEGILRPAAPPDARSAIAPASAPDAHGSAATAATPDAASLAPARIEKKKAIGKRVTTGATLRVTALEGGESVNASVSLNGVSKDQTPLTVKIPAGKYELVVKRGAAVAQRSVTLPPATITKVVVTLGAKKPFAVTTSPASPETP